MNVSYKNKKGKEVTARVSQHALNRFKERYTTLTGSEEFNAEERFLFYFNKAVRKKNTHPKERVRKKRYRTGDVYLVYQQFMFVITDATVVTVELTGSKMRWQN